MRKVRIVRTTKTAAQQNFKKMGGLMKILQVLAKWQGAAGLEQIQQARLEDVQARTRVSEMRMQKLANDLVLQDLKILKAKKELNLPTPELGQDFNPENYDH